MKSHIEIHPAVMLLLIILALIGVDVVTTRQRKAKRVTSQPTAQPAKPAPPPATPRKPFSPPQAPMAEPITQSNVTVERGPLPEDSPLAAPKPPFGNRRSTGSGTSPRERAQARIDQDNAEVVQAFKTGVNAYVQQRQPQPQQ